ncbi:PE family protein [Mycobacterium lepromatosis]|nr:PE family protein [Mycobacterium lepromatosis]
MSCREDGDVACIVALYRLAVATDDWASIGSVINAASLATVTAITGMLALAADEMSATTASLFAESALIHQAVSVQAATFHNQFVCAISCQWRGRGMRPTKAANALPL